MCFPPKKSRKISGSRDAQPREPKIIIVGAGVAGIACATKLFDYGFKDVLVLEAQSRIGGRIHTVPFADNVVDLGAQWCHGQTDNLVYKMLEDKGLTNLLDTTGDIYISYDCIRSNGEKIPEDVSDRLKEIIADILDNRELDISSHNGSLSAYLGEKYFEALELPENAFIDKRFANEFWENFKKLESTETSMALDEVSAYGFNQYYQCEGDYMLNWKDQGYAQFLRLLLRTEEYNSDLGLLEGKILFETVVDLIKWNNGKEGDDKVAIFCEDDSREPLRADHVIVTVSLGVLKENYKKMFEPSLPEEKRRAINGLGFGTVGKIFIEFPEKFWPDSWTGFSTLWREEELENLRGTPHFWLEDVFGFYCVNYQPRVLVVWTVGKLVMFIESLSKNEIKENLLYLLRIFLPKWKIPDPKDILITNWESNRFFRGSYSFRSMQTELVRTNAHSLSMPLTILTYAESALQFERESMRPLAIKPVVLFAGEATSNHYYSTVHGAMESGYREAGRLAGYYGKHSVNKVIMK